MYHIYEYSQVISCVQKSVALLESLLMSHIWAIYLLHFCISKLINGEKKKQAFLVKCLTGLLFVTSMTCVKLVLLWTQVRQMAAVLLRRLLSSSFEEIYPGLTLPLQVAIKSELLAGIQQESSPNIRRKICDVAAELSRNLIGMCGNVGQIITSLCWRVM